MRRVATIRLGVRASGGDGRLETLVRTAVERQSRAAGPSLELRQIAAGAVAEADLVFSTEGFDPDLCGDARVVVVTGAEPVATDGPIGTLAAIHRGAAAVVEGVTFLADDVLDRIMVSVAVPGRVLIVGRSAPEFARFHETITADWATYERPDLDPVCFAAAIAVAQLPVLRSADGHNPTSWKGIAPWLNEQQETTGFYYAENTLRRALSQLGKIWEPEEEIDEADPLHEREGLKGPARLLLPDRARDNGFPRRPPELRGVPRYDVGRALYDTLGAISEVALVQERGIDMARVRYAGGRPRR